MELVKRGRSGWLLLVVNVAIPAFFVLSSLKETAEGFFRDFPFRPWANILIVIFAYSPIVIYYVHLYRKREFADTPKMTLRMLLSILTTSVAAVVCLIVYFVTQ